MRSTSIRHWLKTALISGCCALAAPPVSADFALAIETYRAGKYDEARAQFQELAELGHGASQFNLGAMLLRGEGIEPDPGTAIGWLRASIENGYDGITLARLQEGEAQLSEAQRRAVGEVVARYGREALSERVLPRYDALVCKRAFEPPRSARLAKPDFLPLKPKPTQRRFVANSGIVIVDFIVGVDGVPRDPQVVAAAPARVFDKEALSAALRSRFTPAQLDGKPVEMRYAIRTSFRMDRVGVWNDENIEQVKRRAEEGETEAQFVVGLLGTLDSELGIPRPKAQRFMLSAAQAGNADAQYWIAGELTREGICNDAPGKSRIWLQQAARSPLVPAKLELVYAMLADPAAAQKVGDLQALLTDIIDGENPHALKHATALLSGVIAPQLQDKARALQAAQKLDRLEFELDPQVSEAIAAAHAVNGDFEQAAKFQQRALRTAQGLKWNTQLVEQRLAEYKTGKVWRGELFVVPAVAAALPK
jgi:uncharacterized protein